MKNFASVLIIFLICTIITSGQNKKFVEENYIKKEFNIEKNRYGGRSKKRTEKDLGAIDFNFDKRGEGRCNTCAAAINLVDAARFVGEAILAGCSRSQVWPALRTDRFRPCRLRLAPSWACPALRCTGRGCR